MQAFARHVENVRVNLGAYRQSLIVSTRNNAGLVCSAPFHLQVTHLGSDIEIEAAHGFPSGPCVVSILLCQYDDLQTITRQFFQDAGSDSVRRRARPSHELAEKASLCSLVPWR